MEAVIVVVSGVSKDRIDPLIDCMGHSPCMKDAMLKVIVEELDTPGIDLESERVMPGEYARERLTKKFLFGLPDGAIVVGNCCSSNGRPYFAARLDTGTDRSRIWRRAINSNDDQRICNVYWDEQDVERFHGYSLESLMDDDDESPLPMFRM
jgi:hypothetical protein